MENRCDDQIYNTLAGVGGIEMGDTITKPNSFDIYDEGLRLLTEHMGVLKAETFISVLLREQFDYTRWHRSLVDKTTKEQFRHWEFHLVRLRPVNMK